MIRNYLKIAFRNLVRDRSFAILNIAGLAIGLASVIMIMAYIRYELSYDKSYSNHSQVYRLVQEVKTANVDDYRIYVPVGLAQTLQREFPAVSTFSIVNKQEMQFKYHNDIVKMNLLEGGVDFFKLFDFKFLEGNPKTALDEKWSIVITKKIADKFFKGKNPVGSFITESTGRVWHITAVINDIPANTHITGDAIQSLNHQKYTEDALNWQAYTSLPQYVLLNKNTDPKKLEATFSSIYKKYKFPPQLAIHLQPVTDIHLRSHTEDELWPNSDIKYIYIFLSVAVLILFIACINYINLTTARSLHRAKEIGLRKVLGAVRGQLIIQFLTESFLFFLCSTVLAILIVYALWPAFSARITAYQQIIPLYDAGMLGLIFVVFAAGGLLSGAYPAFFLSSLQPVKILKGLSKYGINISIRKALVVLQFTISGVLIVSTIVVYQQLNYVNNARLGFNKDHLVTVPFYMFKSHANTFKNELLKNNDIQSVSLATWSLGKHYGSSATMSDKKDTTKTLSFKFIDADLNFIKTMGIQVETGRNFSAAQANDVMNTDSLFNKKLSHNDLMNDLASKSIILNQEAVKVLGLKNPEGTVLKTGAVQGTVVGVVHDFNGLSLHQKIGAVIIRCYPNIEFGQMYIRVSPANTQKTINYIESKWKGFYPDHIFDFSFADDNLQQLYTADRRMGTLFGTFASLAIIIACLGLFGLVSLTVQNRVKEIGIRKVLGASIADITSLISVDFIKLVFASFIISSPIAWYFMNKWLQDFAYRINIEWWVFALACGLAIFIAFATLSFQSIKAAMANPVKSLRNE